MIYLVNRIDTHTYKSIRESRGAYFIVQHNMFMFLLYKMLHKGKIKKVSNTCIWFCM